MRELVIKNWGKAYMREEIRACWFCNRHATKYYLQVGLLASLTLVYEIWGVCEEHAVDINNQVYMQVNHKLKLREISSDEVDVFDIMGS